jgi:hypothetical protein
MTPTRSEFQAVAEWLGVPLVWGITGKPYRLDIKDDGIPWQPHLPGADCFALMAALGVNGSEVQLHVFTTYLSFRARGLLRMVDHDDTTATIEAALASAVFECAVRVARI